MKLRPKEEKDCTDQLLECTTDCDPKDKECETECVEEYKECEVPQEDYAVDEGDLIAEILQIAALLNGTATRMETLTSTGISSKKIIIEYDVKHKAEVGTD